MAKSGFFFVSYDTADEKSLSNVTFDSEMKNWRQQSVLVIKMLEVVQLAVEALFLLLPTLQKH